MTFSISFLIKALRVPKNVIGQADSMTSIEVEGIAFDPMLFFALLGIAALAVVIILAIQYIRKNKLK